MKALRVPALAAALVLSAAATPAAAILIGSGHPATEERSVSGYHGIGLSAPADVEIVQGGAEGATVTADDNVLAKVETKVEDGILKIRLRDDDSFTLHTRIHVVVRAKSLDHIAVSGSGDVHAKTLDTPRLKVAISGSGDVALPALTTQALAAHVSGSGDITAAGHADAFEAHMAGSGDVKATHLETQSADLHIAGSSDVSIWVKKSLTVSVAGSGDVRYSGDPDVRRSMVGSGDIKRLGASPP
jgi:hypothetical protein